MGDGSASGNRDHSNNHNHHSHGHGHNHGGGYSNKPEWLQQYDLIGKIGEGTYGLVFLVRTKSPSNRGKSIAIKKFKQSKDGDGVSPTAIREIMVYFFPFFSLQFIYFWIADPNVRNFVWEFCSNIKKNDWEFFPFLIFPGFPWILLLKENKFEKWWCFWIVQLLREISHENVVKLVNVHINHTDMSLYLAFDYAEHDLYVSIWCFLLFFFRSFEMGFSSSADRRKCGGFASQEIIRHHRDKVNHAINHYTVKTLLWQLLNGLNYLHRYGFVCLTFAAADVSFCCCIYIIVWLLVCNLPCSNWIIHRDLKPSNILVWFA